MSFLANKEFLDALVVSSLYFIDDNGSSIINFEGFCDRVSHIPGNVAISEWINYWIAWKRGFEQEKDREKRYVLFDTCILNLKKQGFLKENIPLLTGNFSERITNLLLQA